VKYQLTWFFFGTQNVNSNAPINLIAALTINAPPRPMYVARTVPIIGAMLAEIYWMLCARKDAA